MEILLELEKRIDKPGKYEFKYKLVNKNNILFRKQQIPNLIQLSQWHWLRIQNIKIDF